MISLQAITTQNIFDNLVINNENKAIIEQFIVNYLDSNPKVANEYLDRKGLYHVYFRQRDPYFVRDQQQKDISLLKSFYDKTAAVNWIIGNGRDIVIEQELNYADDAIVITIIYHDNNGNYCMGEQPDNFSLISDKRYNNFAFSANGYLLLLDEHIKCVQRQYYDDVEPTWIHYYKEDGQYVNGVVLSELPKLDETNKQCLKDILDFYQQ